MAKALVNKIGTGTGKLYCVNAVTDVVIMVDDNDYNGVKQMRQLGVAASPLAAVRSATGKITIEQVDGGGQVTDIEVNSIAILGAPFSVTTTDEVYEAEQLAIEINAYTPVSGPKYFAVAIDGTIFLQAPEGAMYNNYDISFSANVGSIIASVEAFDGGSDNNGVYDLDLGLKFYLDDKVDATNTIDFDTATDVTTIFACRGLQTGLITENITIEDDAISIERKSALTVVNLESETGGTDVLVSINPTGFIGGDILLLRTISTSDVVSIETISGSASTTEPKNIILTGGAGKCNVDVYRSLLLMYNYIDERSGGYFTELVRTETPLLIEIDYDDLWDLKDDGSLIPGMKYAIISGKEYSEVLVLNATSESTLDYNCSSREFPTDLITYDFDNDKVIFRHDTVKNLSARWDWRNKIWTIYKYTIDVSGLSFPLVPTEISDALGPQTLTDYPELNSVSDLAAWLANQRKSALFTYLGTDIIFYSHIQNGLNYLIVDDGAPQTINTFVETEIECYTFGNIIYNNFYDGTPVFTPAPDGNGGDCYDIKITSNDQCPVVIGSSCYGIDLNCGAGGGFAIIGDRCYASQIEKSFVVLLWQQCQLNTVGGAGSYIDYLGYWVHVGYLGGTNVSGMNLNSDLSSFNYKINIITCVNGSDNVLRLYDNIRCSYLGLSSTYLVNATQSVDKIYSTVNSVSATNTIFKVQPNTGVTLEITPTAYGSLANEGEIVSEFGTFTLDGDNQDFMMIELFAGNYWRVLEFHNFV